MMSTSFNPRAREGRDFFHHDINPAGEGFNPRAREGRDINEPLLPV